MKNIQLLSSLKMKADTKILLLVMDGLGGFPGPEGKSELEVARTPNLDALAASGASGLMDTVCRGITPGSGPGHLGLFGYDPLTFTIGRGALEAAGIDFDLRRTDVATRFNFCTLDRNGNITDRRAGRIPTDVNQRLVQMMRQAKVPGVEIFVESVKDHRGVAVFRKEGLNGCLHDTDPQVLGAPPLKAEPCYPEAREMADIANAWLAQVYEIIKNESPANGILTRGWCNYPEIPTYQDAYGLNPACIAVYPMYRGVAKFAGMHIYKEGITDFISQADTLYKVWPDHDYFFVHFKYTDSAGEDGDFDRKVAMIEEVDRNLTCLLDLHPDVIAVTGDHSTPAMFKGHTWHPVPVVMAGKWVRPDRVTEFTESAAINGGLGRFEARYLMNELMAAAGRLTKFGA